MSVARSKHRLGSVACRACVSIGGIVAVSAMLAALLIIASGAAADSAKGGRESRVTVPLRAVGGSGVTGVATFVRADGVTVVKVAITGSAGVRYLPDIRSGTCAKAAAMPDVPLSIVESGSAGATTIDLSVADLLAGPNVVLIHSASPAVTSLDPGSAVACGRILRTKVRASPTPTPTPAIAAVSAPSTGIGPMVGVGGNSLILPLAGAGVAAGSAGLLLKRRIRSMGRPSPTIEARSGSGGGTR